MRFHPSIVAALAVTAMAFAAAGDPPGRVPANGSSSRSSTAVSSSRAPSPSAGGGSDLVALRPIDRATLRVVALTRVSIESARGPNTGMPREVANAEAGHGTGLAISADGLVLTARHVVADAIVVAVMLPGTDTAIPARVVYEDPERDCAFVRARTTFRDYVTLSRSAPALQSGQMISVSGYPMDARERYPATASGMISRATNDGRLQLGISLNPGNSGGPVLDENGAVVGVISARGSPEAGVQGIALAEPIRPVLAVLHGSPPPRLPAPENEQEERIVARVVADLVRGVDEHASDIDEQLERFHRELIEEGTRSDSPVLLVLAAADVWNALMVLLEQQRVGSIYQLRPDMRRDAESWLQFVVAACEEAERRDGSVRTRFPFASGVLGAVENARRSQRGAPVAGYDPRDTPIPEYHPEPTVRVRRWFEWQLGPQILLDLQPGNSGIGFGGRMAFLAAPLRFQRGMFELVLLAGGNVDVAYWRGLPAFETQLDIALRGRVSVVSASVGYLPGLIAAENRVDASWFGYHADVGATLGRTTLALRYHEATRGANTPIRSLGFYVGIGF